MKSLKQYTRFCIVFEIFCQNAYKHICFTSWRTWNMPTLFVSSVFHNLLVESFRPKQINCGMALLCTKSRRSSYTEGPCRMWLSSLWVEEHKDNQPLIFKHRDYSCPMKMESRKAGNVMWYCLPLVLPWSNSTADGVLWTMANFKGSLNVLGSLVAIEMYQQLAKMQNMQHFQAFTSCSL